MILSFPHLCIKETGTPTVRGVFALRAFAIGEIVEVCPVLLFDADGLEMPKPFDTRVFAWAVLVGAPTKLSALALGYGSMYNSANPANMRFEADAPNELLRFIAVRTIAASEELTVNYSGLGGVAESPDDVWFEQRGMKPAP
jgi:hypothetical protein